MDTRLDVIVLLGTPGALAWLLPASLAMGLGRGASPCEPCHNPASRLSRTSLRIARRLKESLLPQPRTGDNLLEVWIFLLRASPARSSARSSTG